MTLKSPASLGIIVIDTDFTYNPTGIRVLNHEYGHYLHLQQIGAISYVSNVMIPSLAGAALDKLGILPDGIYYSLPWEHIAEQLGNVNQGGYTEWAHGYASAYWVWTVIVDKLV